jgi:hypothetical protein
MTVVNIAFSSGIDSTALLIMALRKGFRVNLHMINVSGILETTMFEAYAMQRIVDEVKKMEFKGNGGIDKISYGMHAPFKAWQSGPETPVCNSIVQQFATVLGMANIRRMNSNSLPGTWIGWNREDASESSFCEYDHSEQDYDDMVNLLPKLIGRLGNGDNLETPFRLPLWNKSKKEIYSILPPSIRNLTVVNGRASVIPEKNKVVYNAYPHKLKELGLQLDMEMREHWEVPLTDIPAHIRIMCGYGLPADIEMESTEESLELVMELSKVYTAGQFDIEFEEDKQTIVRDFKHYVNRNIELVTRLSAFKLAKEEAVA